MIFSSLYGGKLDRELGTDDRQVLFTTERRQGAVNDGIKRFNDDTECFVNTQVFTPTPAATDFTLSSTIFLPGLPFMRFSGQTPLRVLYYTAAGTEVYGPDRLVQRSEWWLSRYVPGYYDEYFVTPTVKQIPRYYSLRQNQGATVLRFSPQLSTAAGDDVQIELNYVAEPPALTLDTEEPYYLAPEVRPYHQAIVHYAAAQLEKLRRDYTASDRQMAWYQEYVDRWRRSHQHVGGQVLQFARSYFPFGNAARGGG